VAVSRSRSKSQQTILAFRRISEAFQKMCFVEKDLSIVMAEGNIELPLSIHTVQAIPASLVEVYDLGSSPDTIFILRSSYFVVGLLVVFSIGIGLE